MTDRPILFSGPMVRALLDGRKTQTRRVLGEKRHKLVAGLSSEEMESLEIQGWNISDSDTCFGDHLFKVPVSVGDRLWVRETWQTHSWAADCVTVRYQAETQTKGFTAQIEQIPYPNGDKNAFKFVPCKGPNYWRPSIHMPRWASRLTLTVTDVRVQRLQAISEQDAKAEGLKHWVTGAGSDWWEAEGVFNGTSGCPVFSFKMLWNSLNDDRGYGWNANPWVAVYTFTVHKENIDRLGAA